MATSERGFGRDQAAGADAGALPEIAATFDDAAHSTGFDLAVIGAGPAGMAAAATAAEHGLHVALIDAGRQLGGQYYRHPAPGLTAPWLPRLYHGWPQFEQLVTRVETATGIEVLFGHQVWSIEPGFRVLTDRGPVEARHVLLTTGAYERVVPFPGWDLPGVFTAGGAQALLKGNLVLPGRRVVVAGTGPLLLPVAAGLATAGAKVLGLYEANPIRGYAKNPVPLLANPAKLAEGLDYARQFARARLPVHTGRMVIEAQGTDAVEAVVVARLDGSDAQRIACDTLAIGYGLAPQIDLALTLGAAAAHLADGTVALRVDAMQRTSVPGLYAAGETAGVAGAETALVEGEIAGLAVARAVAGVGEEAASEPKSAATRARAAGKAVRALGNAGARLAQRMPRRTDTAAADSSEPARGIAAARARLARRTAAEPERAEPAVAEPAIARPAIARPAVAEPAVAEPAATELVAAEPTPAEPPAPDLPTLQRRRTRQRALADLLRARHPIPAAWREHLAPDTVVCRCEEVPASAITEAVADLGAGDARTVKLLTRAGMGWCQGRVCGYAVACLARDAEPPSEADLLAAAKRPLARPVPLGVLAEQDKRNK